MLKTKLESFEIPFNHITLGNKLGEGGFGVVYKATYLEADAAVKKLKADTITPQAKEEFLSETKIMSQLRSPFIVQLYGISTEPYAIVMEYMPKGSLFSLLHSKEPMEWTLRYSIGIDVGKGIHFLHTQKIIHRDLKSPNVLLDKNYQPKLSDFGLAKLKSESSTTTKSTKLMGTTRWKAPELFKRGNTATYASDIYAYGMILWEIASRQIPYQEESDDQTVISWIKDGEQETLPNNCPKLYNDSIKASWQMDPAKRPDALMLIGMLKEGQKLQSEQELAPKEQPATGKSQPNSSNVTSGPSYLKGSSSSKQEIESGPNYVSVPHTQITADQIKPSPAPTIAPTIDLPLTDLSDTPQNLLQATVQLLEGRDWSSKQKAYFDTLIGDIILPVKTYVLKEALSHNGSPPSERYYPFFQKNLKSQGARCIKTLKGHADSIYALAELDSGQLASGSFDATIKIWNLKTGACVQTLKGHTGIVSTLISLNSEQLASGSFDNTIKIWNLKTGACVLTLEGHTAAVNALISLNSGHLVSGSSDNTIRVWELTTGRCIKTLEDHVGAVNTLVLLSNGQLGSGSYDETIKLWDLDSGKCLKSLKGHTGSVTALVQLSDGYLASGSHDYKIRIWDLTSGEQVRAFYTQDAMPLISTLVPLNSRQLARGAIGMDKAIKIWDLQSGICVKTIEGHADSVRVLTRLSDWYLASGSNDSTIKIWDMTLDNTLQELEEIAPECKMM